MGLATFKIQTVINQIFSALILKLSTFSESAESMFCDGSPKKGEYCFLIGAFLLLIYGIIMALHKKIPNVNEHKTTF